MQFLTGNTVVVTKIDDCVWKNLAFALHHVDDGVLVGGVPTLHNYFSRVERRVNGCALEGLTEVSFLHTSGHNAANQ